MMDSMKTIALFDRGAASYALCVGIPLVRVLPGTWLAYEFDDSDGLASAALAAWKAGTGLVNARAYWNAFKTLRNFNPTNTTIDGEKNHDAAHTAPNAR